MSNKKSKHILKLSTQEKQAFLESFDHIFSDIDGVAFNVRSDINGAAEGYKFLESVGKKVTFITNNSFRSSSQLDGLFKKINLEVDLDSVWHPAKSIVKYLKSINFEGLIYLIGSENFKKTLCDAGYEVIDGPHEIIKESIRAMSEHIFDGKPVRAVIMDVDINLTSVKMIRAQQYLRNPDCLFISGATDLLLPLSESVSILGPGYFIEALMKATYRTPIMFGKPGADLGELLKKDYHFVEPKRSLMIGDNIEQDIGFGKTCGFQTLLVLSGANNINELLSEKDLRLIPDYYADSMGDFIEFKKDIFKSNV